MTTRGPDLEDLLARALAEADPTLEQRVGVDQTAYLDLIRLGVRAGAFADEVLQRAVGSARAAGLSWEAIGAELGVSRQAAQQRFGAALPNARVPVVPEQGDPARQRLLTPLTAFNEMAVLGRVGRYGWHSVAYGPTFHIVEKTEQQWDHVRVPSFGRRSASLEAAGWQSIGRGWFPWAYYKRQAGAAALAEPPGWDPLA